MLLFGYNNTTSICHNIDIKNNYDIIIIYKYGFIMIGGLIWLQFLLIKKL